MKGISENNPTLSKFQFTWNASFLFITFRYIQEIPGIKHPKSNSRVCVADLISEGHRAPIIHGVRVSNIKILDNKIVILFISLIKQTKPTKAMATLCFQTYNKKSKLCFVNYLTEYLKGTKSYRDTDSVLFTCIKAYKVASKDTIYRWCKSNIKESGISIYN